MSMQDIDKSFQFGEDPPRDDEVDVYSECSDSDVEEVWIE